MNQQWERILQDMGAPSVFARRCDTLGKSANLSEAAPDIATSFKKLVADLPSEFSRCTNEASRYAIGVERPCALVRLLGKCGPAAKDAVPALRKYKWFIGGKRFIQSSMVVVDLDAGQVTPPPTTPTEQIDAALRAIMGMWYYIRKTLIIALWAAVLVALWWKPLGNWPTWLRIILSLPSASYFLFKLLVLVVPLLRRIRR